MASRGRWLVTKCWLARVGFDPVKLLSLLDCSGAAAATPTQHATSPAALAAGVVLDAAEDKKAGKTPSPPGSEDGAFGWALSANERFTLTNQLATAVARLKNASADAHAAAAMAEADVSAEDDDGDGGAGGEAGGGREAADKRAAAAGAASASAFLLLRCRAERCAAMLKGGRKEDALEALLPAPADFADLLALCLSLAAAAIFTAQVLKEQKGFCTPTGNK